MSCLGCFPEKLPYIAKAVAFPVTRFNLRNKFLSLCNSRTIYCQLSVHGHTANYRCCLIWLTTCPHALHRLHHRSLFSIERQSLDIALNEHAEPGRSALLFLPPEEAVGAKTSIGFHDILSIALFINLSFLLTGLLNRRSPLGPWALPPAGRPPLGNKIGSLVVRVIHHFGELSYIAVAVYANKVEAWCILRN